MKIKTLKPGKIKTLKTGKNGKTKTGKTCKTEKTCNILKTNKVCYAKKYSKFFGVPLIDIIKKGNKKLSKDVLIFNMQAAKNCISFKMGLCKVGLKDCYAARAENIYPPVLPYRLKQEKYWSNTDVDNIINDFDLLLQRKKYQNIKYFRYNESGDFTSKEDIIKLDCLSCFLKEKYNIITYGYTARFDLFEKLRKEDLSFIVKLSGYNHKSFLTTMVLKKVNLENVKNKSYYFPIDKDIIKIESGLKRYGKKDLPYRSLITDKKGFKTSFITCPAQLDKSKKCMQDCFLCAKNVNIAFLKH